MILDHVHTRSGAHVWTDNERCCNVPHVSHSHPYTIFVSPSCVVTMVGFSPPDPGWRGDASAPLSWDDPRVFTPPTHVLSGVEQVPDHDACVTDRASVLFGMSVCKLCEYAGGCLLVGVSCCSL